VPLGAANCFDLFDSRIKNASDESIRAIQYREGGAWVSRLVHAGGRDEPFHTKSILEHFYATHEVEFDIFE